MSYTIPQIPTTALTPAVDDYVELGGSSSGSRKFLASTWVLTTDPRLNTAGTVESVQASGGATGLSFSGGPITTSGTLTLGGTLAIASGGTGLTNPALVAGNSIAISNAWPNQTVALSSTPNIGTATGTSLALTGDLSGAHVVSTVTDGTYQYELIRTGTNAHRYGFAVSAASGEFLLDDTSASATRLRISTAGVATIAGGLVGTPIGASSPSTGAFTTLSATGGISALGTLNALRTSDSLTNATTKQTRWTAAHYLNAEEDMMVLYPFSDATTNTIAYGGGAGANNAATKHDFYTAANNTTTTGTLTASITSTGLAVTGSISATNFVGPVAGNAATATALATARAIGGTLFDGSAPVTSFPSPGPIGGTTASTGAFTTLSATTSLAVNRSGTPAPTAITTNAAQFVGATGESLGLEMDTFAATPFIYGRRAAGVAGAPTATQSGNNLLAIQGNGYGTTGYPTGGSARILFQATENFTDSATGGAILLQAAANGSLTLNTVASITSTGLAVTGALSASGTVSVSGAGAGTVNINSTSVTAVVHTLGSYYNAGANYADLNITAKDTIILSSGTERGRFSSAGLSVTGAAGVTSFTGSTQLGLRVVGATSTNDYSGLDFSTGTQPARARIASYFTGAGSYLVFGTSNNYTTGVTNSALTIDYNGVTTLAGGLVVTGAPPSFVAGSLYFNATDGLTLGGKAGSGSDFLVANSAGSVVLRNPTGTTNVVVNGTVTANSFSGPLSGDASAATSKPTGTGSVARSFAARADDVFNVKDFGAVGNGSTNDRAAILAADTAALLVRGVVYFPAGTFLVSTSLTIASACVFDGGSISVASAQTVTFSQNLSSPHYKIFYGSGVVRMPAGAKCPVEWWGAGTGTDASPVNDSASIQAAIEACRFFGGTIAELVFSRKYWLGTVLTVSSNIGLSTSSADAQFLKFSGGDGKGIHFSGSWDANRTYSLPNFFGFTVFAIKCEVNVGRFTVGLIDGSNRAGDGIALGCNTLGSNALDNIFDIGYIANCKSAIRIYSNVNSDSQPTLSAGALVGGVSYVIQSVGTTDFTLIGAASNTPGVVFVASGAGSGDGTASPTAYLATIEGNEFNVNFINGCENGVVFDSLDDYTLPVSAYTKGSAWDCNLFNITALDAGAGGGAVRRGFWYRATGSQYSQNVFRVPAWFGGFDSSGVWVDVDSSKSAVMTKSTFELGVRSGEQMSSYDAFKLYGNANEVVIRGSGNIYGDQVTTTDIFNASATAAARATFNGGTPVPRNRIRLNCPLPSSLANGAVQSFYAYSPFVDKYSNRLRVSFKEANGCIVDSVVDNSTVNANEVKITLRNVSGSTLSSGAVIELWLEVAY